MSLDVAEALKEEVVLLKEKNGYLEEENERLRHNLKLMRKHQFGARSEKFVDESEQMLFNEVEVEAAACPEETQEELEIIIPSHKRRPKGRKKKKPFPENIPREEVIIDLNDDEKWCPRDGTELTFIGYDVTEKLKCIPAKMTVVEEKKTKYSCPCCDGYMVQAKSSSVLPKTIATVELLSFIIFSKFYQGLPLYRIEELFKLQKITIHRGTMANWLIRLSEKLMPLWNILEERAFESGYMTIDATRVQVLKEKGKKPEAKSAMWARGSPERGIILFDYDPSEGGKVARRLMEGYEGALQADAHPGYSELDQKKIDQLGCMMHARRNFYKEWLRVGKKAGLAKDALRKFKKLYKFEEAYKEQGLSHERRYEARLKEVKPFIEKMKKWMELLVQKVPPGGKLAGAFKYYINHYEELSGFLKDGRYEIDNGWVERMIRKFAIGRKNWLFSDTVPGAQASALFYSFVITAKLNDKDPFEALTEIFQRLPKAETIDDYEKLADLLLK